MLSSHVAVFSGHVALSGNISFNGYVALRDHFAALSGHLAA